MTPRETNQYWPFDHVHQWKLAQRLVLPNIHPKADIVNFAVNNEENSFLHPGRGFKNLADFYSRLDALTDYDGKWSRGIAGPRRITESWMPQAVDFEYKDTFAVMKDLLTDIRLKEHMTYKPKKIKNLRGERVYSELWSGDWWWRVHVVPHMKAFLRVGRRGSRRDEGGVGSQCSMRHSDHSNLRQNDTIWFRKGEVMANIHDDRKYIQWRPFRPQSMRNEVGRIASASRWYVLVVLLFLTIF